MIRLSILIPVYNAEQHIARCLESIIDQNIPASEYEVLIRDDGSTDSSAALIKPYVDKFPHIKYFRDTNRGAYAQRNILLDNAGGEFFYFMDADDYLVRKTLGTVLEKASKHNADLTCFDIKLATWQDPDLVKSSENLSSIQIQQTTGKDFLEKNLEIRYEIWWYLIRREFIEDLGLRFEESRYHNDVVFTLQLFLAAHKLVYIPLSIYYYYQSQGSIMRKKGKDHSDKLVIAGKKLISDYAAIVKREEQRHPNSPVLMANLNYTLDKFGFYLILRMVKMKHSFSEIKGVMNYLKEYSAYPNTHYTGEDMPKRKFYILNTLFQNRLLLSTYLRFN